MSGDVGVLLFCKQKFRINRVRRALVSCDQFALPGFVWVLGVVGTVGDGPAIVLPLLTCSGLIQVAAKNKSSLQNKIHG